MNTHYDYDVYCNNPEKIGELWEAAHIDKLTKLYNRYGMEEWITGKLEEQQGEECSALLIMDVDNFKSVNDTYGHMLGDALLVEIADMIQMLFGQEYFAAVSAVTNTRYLPTMYRIKKKSFDLPTSYAIR